MTSPEPKPPPDHGTYARAVGRPAAGVPGCRCTKCKKVRREYKRRADYLAATGRALTVDSGPACEHLRALKAQGAAWNPLRAATGCSTATISDYLHGRRPRIHRSTSDRILAVRLEQVLPEPRAVPALGTVRRARALMALGHCPEAIAEAAGCHATTVTDLVYECGSDLVRPATARRIAAAYEKLSARPGTHVLSKRRAKANGWMPPLAWDDIDNPDAEPNTGEPDGAVTPREARSILAASRADEITHLASFGIPAADIAARVGLSVDYVRDQLAGTRKPGWRDEVSA